MDNKCKTCAHCKPTYKGYRCEIKDKKTKLTDVCEKWAKRATALLLAVILAAAPMTAKAAEKMSTELVAYDSDGTIVSGDKSEHTIEWWPVAYKPAEIYIAKQAHAIGVYADVTTAAKNVIVQYSRDKEFKSGVTTKTFRNVSYKGPVLAFLATDGGLFGNLWHFTDTVIIKQDGKTLHSRRKHIGEWGRLRITQADVNASRKQVRSLIRMYIPGISNPTGLYVRVRSVYPGQYRRVIYSGWSRVVRVR